MTPEMEKEIVVDHGRLIGAAEPSQTMVSGKLSPRLSGTVPALLASAA